MGLAFWHTNRVDCYARRANAPPGDDGSNVPERRGWKQLSRSPGHVLLGLAAAFGVINVLIYGLPVRP